jgi:DNA-binding protein YbaB
MTESAEEWTQRLRDDGTRRLEAVQRMQDELARVHGEARAARGLVSVRVTPAGMPTRLHLDAAATRLPAAELAAEILAAIGEATAQATRRAQAVVGQVVPADALEAMLRGTVTADDRAAVREQLDALRADGR